MSEAKHYAHCNIAGYGKLRMESSGREQKFKLLDMSAENMRLTTEKELGIGQRVHADIHIKGILFEVRVDSEGTVKNSHKLENGIECEIEFLNLPEADREVINQLMIDSAESLQ